MISRSRPVPGGREIGPREIVVTVESCHGCPALVLNAAQGGDGKLHTEAWCAAAPKAIPLYEREGRSITPYWRIDRPPPSWCPAKAPYFSRDTV